MRCDACGREALALEPGGKCRQRAAIARVRKRDDGTEAVAWSCGGKLRLVDRPAAIAGVRCERAGCGNAALFTTALGEGVCHRCLAEMAEAGRASAPGVNQGR